jgi:hypothetical protein
MNFLTVPGVLDSGRLAGLSIGVEQQPPADAGWGILPGLDFRSHGVRDSSSPENPVVAYLRRHHWLPQGVATSLIAAALLGIGGWLLVSFGFRDATSLPPPPAEAGADTSHCRDLRVPGESDNPVSVRMYAKDPMTGCWEVDSDGWDPAQTLTHMIRYENTSEDTQESVVVRVNVPPGLDVVPRSTYLANSTNPDGVLVESDNLATTGLVVGSYLPGGVAYVKFDAAFPFSGDLDQCGSHEYRLVGVVRPEGLNEFYNTVITRMANPC